MACEMPVFFVGAGEPVIESGSVETMPLQNGGKNWNISGIKADIAVIES